MGSTYRAVSRPMQTFTQPSAPAMQAPNQAISDSLGATMPCTSGYARSWNGGSEADGGKSRGSCRLRTLPRVLGDPIEKIYQIARLDMTDTYHPLVQVVRGLGALVRLGGISERVHFERCRRRLCPARSPCWDRRRVAESARTYFPPEVVTDHERGVWSE